MEEVEPWLAPERFTGRSEQQVEDYLTEVVEGLLEGAEEADVEAPRI